MQTKRLAASTFLPLAPCGYDLYNVHRLVAPEGLQSGFLINIDRNLFAEWSALRAVSPRWCMWGAMP